jgi:hypothetical protein
MEATLQPAQPAVAELATELLAAERNLAMRLPTVLALLV